MANPMGEDSWLAYLDESARTASDLERRVDVVEIYKRAVIAEPGSLRLWLGYCNYVWSLWADSQSGDAGWTDEEQMIGRELFSFNTALDLWQQGYEAIKYRLSDSHVFWDRWISLELELLGKTGTPEGIKRITHLYRDRLVTPHLTWDDTAQMYSGFLSEHNRAGWEESMKDMTARSQDAKRLIAERDPYELKLQQAVRANDLDVQRLVMTEYLDWEMIQSELRTDNTELGVNLCRGLFDRALTGLFSVDEAMWHEFFVFLSGSYSDSNASEQLLAAVKRAVQHCPWSGRLWNRYILCAEEARLDFAEVESIKHAATSENQLYKNGLESLLEMYVAWCGFLKRTAMDPSAPDEAVDVADVGLTAALEDVEVHGQRLCGKDFQGDPKFRLERIYIQYLTEKKGAIEAARALWNKLASIQIHANSYDFWFRFYMWEMHIFVGGTLSNPIHGSSLAGSSARTPTLATAVLHRAATRMTVDWPEKILEVYMQHCIDYEPSTTMRRVAGLIHKLEKLVAKRRAAEQQEKAAAYAAFYGAQEADNQDEEHSEKPPSSQKRKRDLGPENQNDDDGNDENTSKRQKSAQNSGESAAAGKRDRENTTVVVTNLPPEVTQTKLKHYFREFGHINGIPAFLREKDDQSTTAMIEFSSPEEAQSALLRDQKFFGQSQISVKSGHDLTIYVANYPPTADEAYIRQLFRDCGEILSIRWPSLKINVHRRFCYASFRDRDASARAVSKDGTAIGGTYKLLVKYSDPGHKKNREGPVAEGREVYVSGLNTAATEDEVRSIFSRFGTVARINIPRNMSGKGRGFAFVVYESKGEAEEAASELNNTKFLNQILQTEISKYSKVKPSAQNAFQTATASPSRQSPTPAEGTEAMDVAEDERAAAGPHPTSAEIASRTVALLGLPDTVNDARVRALVEPMGAVVKLVLQPSHGGAKIEFADSVAAGRASLQLDNMEFESRKLRIGSLEELRHAKAERTQDRMVYGVKAQKQSEAAAVPKNAAPRSLLPQMTIRRPAPGKTGPKRGLGFVPRKAVSKAAEGGSRDDMNNNHTTPDTHNTNNASPSSKQEGQEEAGEASGAGGTTNHKAVGPLRKSNSEFRTLLLTGSFVKGGESGSSS